VIQLLRMRYFLTERVYYHHTKVAAGAMISKAVELALDAGTLAEADLLALNDWTLLDRLAQCGPAAAQLAARLARRDLLKRGYVVSARSVDAAQRAALVRRFHEGRAERQAAEHMLAAGLGCAEGEVVVYCPALTVMKEASARVVTSRGVGALNDSDDPGTAEIRALQDRYTQLWRLYVFVPAALAERAAPLAAELFGHASEHR
jgi:HD superfamily phosphohydrolase